MNSNQLETLLSDLDSMIAKCGHNDPLGYLSGQVCHKCARRNHREALNGRKPLKAKRR